MSYSLQTFVNSLSKDGFDELKMCVVARDSENGLKTDLFEQDKIYEFVNTHASLIRQHFSGAKGIMPVIKWVKAKNKCEIRTAKEAVESLMTPEERERFFFKPKNRKQLGIRKKAK